MTQMQKDRRADSRYRTQIVAAMKEWDISHDALADALGISRATLARRMKDTASFTRGEDRTLRRVLRMEETA